MKGALLAFNRRSTWTSPRGGYPRATTVLRANLSNADSIGGTALADGSKWRENKGRGAPGFSVHFLHGFVMRPELFEAMQSSNDALYARAWHALKHSASLPPPPSGGRPFHGIPRLRVWENKSGWYVEDAMPYTLTVFEFFTEEYRRYPVVREAAWRRDEDMGALQAEVERSEKVAMIDPTFAVRDGDVPSAEFEALLREATSFRVPLVWLSISASATTDVGSAGFEFFSRNQPGNVLRLEWSCDMPESWRPIVGWVEKMRNFLIGCLPPASGPAHSGNSLVDR